MIGKRLPAGSREAAITADIIARIDTLNQLVKDLLLFARPPKPQPIAVDLSVLLAATAALLGEDASHRDVRVRDIRQRAAGSGGRRAAEDRLHQPAHQQRAGHARKRHDHAWR